MVEFVKKQQEELIKNKLDLEKEKDELIQKIDNLKVSLPTKIETIEREFKIEKEKLEKELIEKKTSAEFLPKRIRLIEKNLKTKIKETQEELDKKIEPLKSEVNNKVNNLEKEFKKIITKINDIQHDIKIMDREIEYFQSEKFVNESEIEELHIKNSDITKKITVLEKEKNKKSKNIFFKIISLGFYNRKKSISIQINELKSKIANNELLIGLKLLKIEKIETKNQASINQLVANANSENQPSTSGYKPNSPKL